MAFGDEADALAAAAVAAQEAADYLRLADVAAQIIARARGDGDRQSLAWGLYFSAASSFQRANGPAAERGYRQAEELFEEIGDTAGRARSMLGRAAVALDIDLDAAQARRLYDVAIPIVRELGDQRRLAIVLGNLGEVHRLDGDCARALRCAAESVALFRAVGDRGSAGWQLASMAHYHQLRRDYGAAMASLGEAYAELERDPIPWCIAWYFDVGFIMLSALRLWEPAARVLGFVNRYRDEYGIPRMQGIFPWFSAPIEELHRRLPDDFDRLTAEGEALTTQTAHAVIEAAQRGAVGL